MAIERLLLLRPYFRRDLQHSCHGSGGHRNQNKRGRHMHQNEGILLLKHQMKLRDKVISFK
ncbi:hypothetical protein Lalb_Chr11g0071481 [Lupinus albus]|uniref:Uncharacterized protein n=1 Tax=Lupinus albus TaxID=3870 RepID=A0A6A4PS16_LUPAL|nr:hypothetical protein Lalb_Chr11g0071481 [Lupinus albus]